MEVANEKDEDTNIQLLTFTSIDTKDDKLFLMNQLLSPDYFSGQVILQRFLDNGLL